MFRNVHFYASTEYLGGCYQGGSLTDANLDWIIRNVLVVTQGLLTIRHRPSGRLIIPSDSPVALGNYDICSDSEGAVPTLILDDVYRITITDEMWLARDASSTSTRESAQAFGTAVCKRDGKCVISGTVNPLSSADMWPGFEAVHVFPRGYEGHWTQHGHDANGSVQNGLLMSRHLHACFVQYLFSINPDVRPVFL